MLKLLLRLWWKKIRQQDTKREIITMSLLALIYFFGLIGVFVVADAMGTSLQQVKAPSFVGLVIVASVTICDLFTKLTITDELTVMDDYLKARPIPQKLWVKFLLITQAARWGTVMLPIIFLIVLLLLQSIGQSLVCFFITMVYCYVNNLFATSFQRTSDKFLKFSIIVGWIGMLMAMGLDIFLFIPAPAWLQYLSMIVLAAAVIAGLAYILSNEENYDEGKRKAKKQLTFGRVNLFTMQLFGLIRARRIRNMVLIEAAIFVGDTYLMLLTGDDRRYSLFMYSILAVLIPPLTLSQATFGVEANFFQGLMSKPITVKHLLCNCYYFYVLLSVACALLILPLAFITDRISVMQLIAALTLAAFINLFNMPTCLYSSRLEIFSKALFNSQGANFKINIFSVVATAIPLVICLVILYFLGEKTFTIVSAVLGTLSFVLHRPVIAYVARLFMKKKYERLEAFSK